MLKIIFRISPTLILLAMLMGIPMHSFSQKRFKIRTFPSYIRTDPYYQDSLRIQNPEVESEHYKLMPKLRVMCGDETYEYDTYYESDLGFIRGLWILNVGDSTIANSFLQDYLFDQVRTYPYYYPVFKEGVKRFSYRALYFSNIWNKDFLQKIVQSPDTALDKFAAPYMANFHNNGFDSTDLPLRQVSNRTLAKNRLAELQQFDDNYCKEMKRRVLRYCRSQNRNIRREVKKDYKKNGFIVLG